MKKLRLIIGLCVLWCLQLNTYSQDRIENQLQQLHDAGIERILVYPDRHNASWNLVQSVLLDDVKTMIWDGDDCKVALKLSIGHENIWYYLEPDYVREASETGLETIGSSYDPYDRIGIDVLKNSVSGEDEAEVIVAVIDSGIDRTESIFQNRLVEGYDFVENDSDPQDNYGHGTSVAGIIARGTTSQVKIMPIKVLGQNGKGNDYAIAKAIQYALENGAKVINLSLAGIGQSTHLDDAMDRALDQGVIIVAGAGNDCIDTKHVYPAGKKEIIVVSAVDTRDQVSLFSNYGDSIDIAAPGEQIDALDDGYIEEGTSLAAPFISAIASMLALLDSRIDSALMEEYLSIYSDDVGLDMKDIAYGYGIVNFNGYTKDESFQIISRNTYVEPYDTSYIKVYSATGNRTLQIKIDQQSIYEYGIEQQGYYTITYDVKLPAGNHQVDLYLEEAGVFKKVDSYAIEVRDYNFVFEVYNQRSELSSDYALRLSGGIDNEDIIYLGDERQQGYYKNGRYYMTLNIKKLLEEYDYLLALCEPKDMNNDGYKVPIYSKKITTTGRKIFRPKSVQTIYYGEASYANVYMQVNDGLTNQYQWVGLSITEGQQQLLLDQGEHRVFIAADKGNFLYTLQNDYYLILNEEDLRQVIIDTRNISNRSMELLTHVAYMDTKPIPFKSYDTFTSLDKVQPVKYNPNRYRLYASLNLGEEGLTLYKDIDLLKHRQEKITFGKYLTNEYVIHYNHNQRQVMVKLLDDLHNRYILYTDRLVLSLSNESTGERYEGRISYNDRYQGVELYEIYDFRYDDIPDGDYVLEVTLDGDFIMPTDFQNKSIRVKNGVFYESITKSPPIVNEIPHIFSIEPYHTFELNLKEVFSSKDELFYTVDQGYIIEDTLYFEGNAKGLFTFHIGAYDFKNHVTTFTCQLIVNDGIIFKKLLEDELEGHMDSSLEDMLYRTYKKPSDDKVILKDDNEDKHTKGDEKQITNEERKNGNILIKETMNEVNTTRDQQRLRVTHIVLLTLTVIGMVFIMGGVCLYLVYRRSRKKNGL